MDDLDAATPRTLNDAAVTIWPVKPPVRLTPLTSGVNNLVYRVETAAGPPRILRVYRNHADVDRVRHEVALLAALRAAALPFTVPTPLATHTGALIHTLPLKTNLLAGALAVLRTEVAGTHPDSADLGQAEAAGGALALLDTALATIDPTTLPGRATLPLRDLRRRVFAPDDIEAALLQLPLPAADTASFVDQLRSVEMQIPPLYTSLPQQLVHADIGPANILMDGAQVSGVLDFEFAHYDLRIADLLVPLSWWRPELFGTGAEWDLWDLMEALGRGYTTHVPLLPGEAQALPLLFRLRSIGGLLRTIAWYRQGRRSEQDVLERAAYTLMRERWLQQNASRLVALAEGWAQAR
jgi:Ser/Thr protein kinase RdoA (MazF antagonist)